MSIIWSKSASSVSSTGANLPTPAFTKSTSTRPYLSRRLGERPRVAARDDDPRALAPELFGRRKTYPGVAARDQRHLAFKLAHPYSPSSCFWNKHSRNRQKILVQ